MIEYEKFKLENGLRFIVHKDTTTPILAMNILYDVGARDENSEQTGFAHLFEHLMFGGSVNIPKYDEPLERAGGHNNAFTNNDITNYYLTLPVQNIETAFWLESDRMLSLAFSKKSLEVQRNVVIEEFKQSYLNQPYGDVWLLLRPLAYKVHPYQWSTIGKDVSHIANAKMEDVKEFFKKYYCPNNAIITIAGNVETSTVKALAEKWFGNIPASSVRVRNLPAEPKQEERRELTVERKVPFDSMYKAYKMCNRMDKKYHSVDLISDILSSGDSSRFYKELVKKRNIFSRIDAYHFGHFDEGIFIVTGDLMKGVSFKEAESAINEELNKITSVEVEEQELEKVKNKAETNFVLSEMNVLSKAMNLSYYELLEDASLINEDVSKYRNVSKKDIMNVSAEMFEEKNCSALYYKAISE